MTTSKFIEARYGDWGTSYLSAEERRRCEGRQRDVWNALTNIVRSDIAEPWTEEVHSPHALPAFLGLASDGPAIVWDAGLGTLLNHLAFPMPYAQPPQVIEAILRRITATRCVLKGIPRQASAQASLAKSLLDQTPIDRAYQMQVDAEEQFEVFLLTEMQERFALAHELAHYLKATDTETFDTFTDAVIDNLGQISPGTNRGVLRELGTDRPLEANGSIYEAGLDPYAWYLYEGQPTAALERNWPSLTDEVATARGQFHASSVHEREEIMCDLLAALSVGLAAHERQRGWTSVMGAACSRLALSNLQAIIGLDKWVSEASDRPWDMNRELTSRERCLNGLLPIMLPKILEASSRGSSLQAGDIHSVMHLVEDRFQQRVGVGMSRLDWAAPNEDSQHWDEEQVLVLAGFLPLRPEVDHRVVNRVAGEHRFPLGNTNASSGVYARYTCDRGFAEQIDEALRRHERGDWGDLPPEGREKNEHGLFEEFAPPTPSRNRRRDSLWSVYLID